MLLFYVLKQQLETELVTYLHALANKVYNDVMLEVDLVDTLLCWNERCYAESSSEL